MKLDEKDQKILEILKNNAKTPLKEIAKTLKLSIPSVSSRIRQLINSGYIKGFHASINYEKLGEACQLVLQIRVNRKFNSEKIGKILAGYDKNCLVLNVTGEYDFLILAKCKNDEEGANFINQIRQIEGIDRVTSHYILKIYKEF